MKRILFLIAAYFISIQALPAQTIVKDSARYVTISMEMPQLKRTRNVQILLPVDYKTSHKKYPVLYMQDAQNLYANNNPRWNCWFVDSVMKTMPDNKQAIIVGINHGGNQRIAEYSPYKSKYGEADGPPYIEFLVQTLKPYIDAHYRTLPDAKHTAIAGSSMGGLISFYANLKYPQLFGTAGVFSPSLWINPEIDQLVKNTAIPAKSRFFFACGDKEGNEDAMVMKMDSLLRSKNVPRGRMPVPLIVQGAEHNERQWRFEFPIFYQWWVKGL